MTDTTICKIEGCGKPSKHLGWCGPHYKRWHRHGDPLGGASSHHATPAEAFAARTVKDIVTGCLMWTGAHDGKSYGHLRIGGKLVKAHRYAWSVVNGEIPEGGLILHRCDNPPCVNADHLFLGNHTDNVNDMDAKGRRVNNQPKGSACHAAKLTADAVIAIRADTRRQADIAAAFGISQAVVSKIKLNQSWAHVK